MYSAVLLGCLIFFIAYQQWLAWFFLAVLLVLPWFSLLVSLPAMLTTKLRISAPQSMQVGGAVELKILHRCPLPVPMMQCKLIVERPLTGEQWKLKESSALPANHCGTLIITVKKARILDYMGLSKLPVRCHPTTHRICVRPVSVPVEDLPSLERCTQLNWKPKPGGGFAENHELRLYRPGDNIQQIHWKLSAKTGSLILREPMEPVRNRVLLRMNLSGTPQVLDRKLGQLLWIGQHLLEKDIHFQIQCLTGQGMELWNVSNEQELDSTLSELLCRPCAMEGSLQTQPESAGWQYYIGGGDHEA